MLSGQIIDIIEKVAPLSQQERWDNSGLQIGQRDVEVTSALLCTDITEAVLQEAIDKGAQMVISHHPLLFHGLKQVVGSTPQERCVVKAIQHNLVLYSSHTSMDNYLRGVSGRMAEKLGIKDYRVLAENADSVGLGVIGRLTEPKSIMSFLEHVKTTFKVPAIKYVLPSSEREISLVAMCGGAGSEFMDCAIAQGADAYISADFKYHEFQQVDGRLLLLDIGHFESEQFTKEIFRDLLSSHVNCLLAEADKSPILVY